jgi:hypothetical protein
MTVTINYPAVGGGTGGGGGGGSGGPAISGSVAGFSLLPSAAAHTDELYAVTAAEGVIFVNRKPAGVYRSDGATWTYVATLAEHDQASEINNDSAVSGSTVKDALETLNTGLGGKQDTITGGATTIVSSNLTTSRALVSDGSGKVAVSAVTATELGHVAGVTSALQTQINGKAPSTSGTSVLKGNGSGGFSSAVSGTDFAPATSGSSVLKGNGSGGFSSAVSGTDYAPATSGSAILKGNGSGGFSSAVAGTDYLAFSGTAKISVGTSAPGSPAVGDLWVDTN